MKVTFEFDTDDAEQCAQMIRAGNADDLLGFIWDYQQLLRAKYKYLPEGTTAEALIEELYDSYFSLRNAAVDHALETWV